MNTAEWPRSQQVGISQLQTRTINQGKRSSYDHGMTVQRMSANSTGQRKTGTMKCVSSTTARVLKCGMRHTVIIGRSDPKTIAQRRDRDGSCIPNFERIGRAAPKIKRMYMLRDEGQRVARAVKQIQLRSKYHEIK